MGGKKKKVRYNLVSNQERRRRDMKKYYCPLRKELCEFGGNKRYNYGFVSGTASYCRKIKIFICDFNDRKCPYKIH